jgi:DNA-directed RNA polymerase subunit beta
LRPTPGFCEFTKEGLQGKTPKEIQKIYDLKRRELIEQLTNSIGNILPLGEPIFLDVVNAETGKILIPANRNITESLVRKLATAHDHIEIDPSPIRDGILDIIGNYEHAFAELEL